MSDPAEIELPEAPADAGGEVPAQMPDAKDGILASLAKGFVEGLFPQIQFQDAPEPAGPRAQPATREVSIVPLPLPVRIENPAPAQAAAPSTADFGWHSSQPQEIPQFDAGAIAQAVAAHLGGQTIGEQPETTTAPQTLAFDAVPLTQPQSFDVVADSPPVATLTQQPAPDVAGPVPLTTFLPTGDSTLPGSAGAGLETSAPTAPEQNWPRFDVPTELFVREPVEVPAFERPDLAPFEVQSPTSATPEAFDVTGLPVESPVTQAFRPQDVATLPAAAAQDVHPEFVPSAEPGHDFDGPGGGNGNEMQGFVAGIGKLVDAIGDLIKAMDDAKRTQAHPTTQPGPQQGGNFVPQGMPGAAQSTGMQRPTSQQRGMPTAASGATAPWLAAITRSRGG